MPEPNLSFLLLIGAVLVLAGFVKGLVAMAAAFAGMFIGQLVRARLDADAFRR